VANLESKSILSRLFSIIIYFEASKFNLLVLKGCGTLFINGLLVFLISLNISLKNLHKTLIKSIIFRLCLLIIVSCLGFLGISTIYVSLLLSCLILWSFNVSKQKTLFIINLLFIIAFWSLVYKYINLDILNSNFKGFEHTVYILILFQNYYTETMNPLDLFSNVNPNDYIETLKNLEAKIRDVFNKDPNNPDPQIIVLNPDSDDNNKDGNLENIFINLPERFLNQAIYKEPYGIYAKYLDKSGLDLEKNLNKVSVSLDQLNDFIINHNNSLDYSSKYPDKLEAIKRDWEGDTKANHNIFWGGGSSSNIANVINMSEEDKNYLVFNIKNKILINLQEYNLALGGFYCYTSEDSSKLPPECKKCFDYIKLRNSVSIFMNLDSLIDNQFLVDSDLYPEKFYTKNYLDDSKTYEEIGDNLLCTGIATLFWYSIEDIVLKSIRVGVPFEKISSILQEKATEKLFDKLFFRNLLNLYKENHLKYDIDTEVTNIDDILLYEKISIKTKTDIFKNISSFNHFSKDNHYNTEDNISPLSFLYGNSYLLIQKFSKGDDIYNCISKLPYNVPLPEQTESEIHDLNENFAANIPLPPITEEENQFFEVNSNLEGSFTQDQSIGEDFLYESLEGKIFPEGF
jgi:hypothetical protein